MRHQGGQRKFRKNFQGRKKKEESENSDNEVVCYGCGKPGHIKTSCPENKEKKREFPKAKNKKAYIAWDDTSDSSSESEEEEIKANICLIAETDDESDNEVYTTDSDTDTDADSDNQCANNDKNTMTYNVLLRKYNKLLELSSECNEALEKTLKVSSERKKRIAMLEQNIKVLEEENNSIKQENAELKLTSLSLKTPIVTPSKCKNCDDLIQDKVKLEQTVAKLGSSRKALKDILDSQKQYSDRTGLGYTNNKQYENKMSYTKKVKTTAHKIDYKPRCCFYCNKPGHTVNMCYLRKYGVTEGKFKWVVKGTIPSANRAGSKDKWIPKSCPIVFVQGESSKSRNSNPKGWRDKAQQHMDGTRRR